MEEYPGTCLYKLCIKYHKELGSKVTDCTRATPLYESTKFRRRLLKAKISLQTLIIIPFFIKSIVGWIGILANWARDSDMRLSVTAGRALANFDRDEQFKANYGRGIYSLHPILRTDGQSKVDVIFVHGLLGGVFYTWRQRKNNDVTLSIMGKVLIC